MSNKHNALTKKINNKIPMNDIIEEIQEDLKSENQYRFFKKYFPAFCLFVALALLLTYAIMWQKEQQNISIQNDEIAYAKFLEKIEQTQMNEKQDFEKIAEFADQVSSNSLFESMANFKKADLLIATEKEENLSHAIEILTKLSKNKDIEPYFQEFALLKIAKLKLAQENSTLQGIKSHLDEISKKSLWHLFAQELLASAYVKFGKNTQAIEIFNEIIAATSPNSSFYSRSKNAIIALKSTN